MSELYEKSLVKLELDQVLALLADCAGSEGGKQSCLNLRPSSDLEEVEQLLQQTTAAYDLSTKKGYPSFASAADVSASLERADRGGSLQPKELLVIGWVLRCTRSVKDYITPEEKQTVLDPLFHSLTPNKYLEERILTSILSEEEIADTASSELADIRRHMRIQSGKIRDSLQKVISSPAYSKFLREPIITIRQGRYVVPVKSECKNDVPGLVHDVSATGSTYFVEPMSAVNANNALRELQLKEKKEIERILAELSSEVAAHAEDINLDYSLLVQLDVVFAKAKLAFNMRAWAPIMNDTGRVELRNARHPLIDPKRVVPISLRLGTDFDTMIITGPNTGGKTVTLKTVGLLTLMAQAGLHVPGNLGTELSIFEQVYADIGDEQSIEQSLSTFSSHMTNIVEIMNEVTQRDLVLFDELGAGTDPTEGAALAQTILDTLLKRQVRTVATTHYSELKAYALSTPGVENASVEFDVATLRPTYRLSIGVPGKSNAFEISRKLGLSQGIIDRAKELLSANDIRFEDVIAGAEYQRQVAQREREAAEQARAETIRLRNEAETLYREMEEKQKTAERKAKEEGRRIVENARREAENVIQELKRMKKEGAEGREAEINALRKRMQNNLDGLSEGLQGGASMAPAPKDLNVGDTVDILHLNTRGTVLSKPDAKGDVQLQAGIMKLKANLSQLRLVQEKKPKKQKSTVLVHSQAASRTVRMECDVRGMTLDEALIEVEKYLDEAVMAGMNEVCIVHGKGTGALRAGIQRHLKSYPHVKSFRLGQYGEGESGVTIVTLN